MRFKITLKQWHKQPCDPVDKRRRPVKTYIIIGLNLIRVNFFCNSNFQNEILN